MTQNKFKRLKGKESNKNELYMCVILSALMIYKKVCEQMALYTKYNTKHYVNIWLHPNPASKRTNTKLNIMLANNKKFKYSKRRRTFPSCFNTREKWTRTI